MNRSLNKSETQSIVLVDSLESVKEIVSEVLDSYSIRKFKLSIQGRQFKLIVPTEYYVPKICLKELESKGYSLETFHSSKKGLEITLGGNRN